MKESISEYSWVPDINLVLFGRFVYKLFRIILWFHFFGLWIQHVVLSNCIRTLILHFFSRTRVNLVNFRFGCVCCWPKLAQPHLTTHGFSKTHAGPLPTEKNDLVGQSLWKTIPNRAKTPATTTPLKKPNLGNKWLHIIAKPKMATTIALPYRVLLSLWRLRSFECHSVHLQFFRKCDFQ